MDLPDASGPAAAARPGEARRVALVSERLCQDSPDGRLVVDHEDSHAALRSWWSVTTCARGRAALHERSVPGL